MATPQLTLLTWPHSFKDTGYMLLHAPDIAASLTVANPGLLFGSDMIPFADAFGIFYPLSATYIAESVIVQATKEGPRFLHADIGWRHQTLQHRHGSADAARCELHHVSNTVRLGAPIDPRMQSACRYHLLKETTLTSPPIRPTPVWIPAPQPK